jgi:hypothetical protein
VPVLSQVCGCKLLHWLAPGEQTPVQPPPLQTYVHAVPVFCQVPPLQVCGCNALHWLEPDVHAEQLPVLQTAPHGVPLLCQVPLESQVCGCNPRHRIAPGAHTPVQVPPLHR